MSPKKPAAKPRPKPPRRPRRRALAARKRPLFMGPKPGFWPFSKTLKVIEIKEGVAGQGSVHLRRHPVTFLPDRVQWVNLDARGRTVVFKDGAWPFLEPPQDILIPAHGNSCIFTVYVDATPGGYGYAILPAEEQGPGQPEVVIDP